MVCKEAALAMVRQVKSLSFHLDFDKRNRTEVASVWRKESSPYSFHLKVTVATLSMITKTAVSTKYTKITKLEITFKQRWKWIFLNCQKNLKNASLGDVWFFNPKNVTTGSSIDQNQKLPSFWPIGQKCPFSMENSLLPLKTLNSHVKLAFSDQWVKKMAIFCFD